MEATAQREVGLYKKSSDYLKQAGYNVTPQGLNPNDQSVLEGIRENLGEGVRVVGSQAEEFLTGQGPDTHIRVSPGKRFGHWVLDRIRRKHK